jgi:hypothetical protein
MTIEQMYTCSRIFMLCAVVFVIIAVILYYLFDIKRISKILIGKKITPTYHKKQKTKPVKIKPEPSNKTVLLTNPLENTEPMITMDISYIHSDITL